MCQGDYYNELHPAYEQIRAQKGQVICSVLQLESGGDKM